MRARACLLVQPQSAQSCARARMSLSSSHPHSHLTLHTPHIITRVKKELISLKCKACGAKSDVDPMHKLNTFIVKNPPDNELSKEEKKVKK